MPPKKSKQAVTKDKEADDKKSDDKDKDNLLNSKRSTRGKKEDKAAIKLDVATKDDAKTQPAKNEKKVAGKAGKNASKKDDSINDAVADTKAKSPVQDTKRKAIAKKEDKAEPLPTKKVKKNDDVDVAVTPTVIESKDMKKIIVKGGAAVDEFVYGKERFHVLEHDGIIYDCTMNQTNIVGGNNNNKFYIVQVLETDANPAQYFYFTRWGRVGVTGQFALGGPSSREGCIREYNSKVRDKSVKGDYRILEKDYAPQQDMQLVEQRSKKAYEESKLHIKIKQLLELIFDLKMMNKQMLEIGYDAKKMPLGKLAKSTIDKGFRVLEQISEAIKNKKPQSEFERLTSEFYSQIPHCFGMSQAPIIKTDVDVKKKLEMLESIQQIQIATKILDEGVKDNENVLDNHYKKLDCNIDWIQPGTGKFQMLESYVKNTHAASHGNYTLDVLEIYELAKDLDKMRFKKEIGNRMLLWHGSRLTNFVGILSQGLRIAPPEAPVTGYMFGKGVYFADMVSKSANYCGTSKENNIGMILLCDVALGNMNDKLFADYNAQNLPPGKQSTRGCGKTAPHPSSYVDYEGCQVPNGVGQPTEHKNGALLYNEYIVYDIAQIQFKFLIKLRYNYK